MGAMRTFLIAASLCGLAHAPALAADWQIRQARSSINFEYQRDGAPADGRFTRFRGSGFFDPADPGQARLTLRIATESIDLDDTLASAFATSAEWFDSRNHPDVIYQLSALTPTGGDAFEATGTITIRGESEVLKTPVTLSVTADSAHATGALQVQRAHFLLGVGPSAAFVEIGETVAVRFDLIAEPVK